MYLLHGFLFSAGKLQYSNIDSLQYRISRRPTHNIPSLMISWAVVYGLKLGFNSLPHLHHLLLRQPPAAPTLCPAIPLPSQPPAQPTLCPVIPLPSQPSAQPPQCPANPSPANPALMSKLCSDGHAVNDRTVRMHLLYAETKKKKPLRLHCHGRLSSFLPPPILSSSRHGHSEGTGLTTRNENISVLKV